MTQSIMPDQLHSIQQLSLSSAQSIQRGQSVKLASKEFSQQAKSLQLASQEFRQQARHLRSVSEQICRRSRYLRSIGLEGRFLLLEQLHSSSLDSSITEQLQPDLDQRLHQIDQMQFDVAQRLQMVQQSKSGIYKWLQHWSSLIEEFESGVLDQDRFQDLFTQLEPTRVSEFINELINKLITGQELEDEADVASDPL